MILSNAIHSKMEPLAILIINEKDKKKKKEYEKQYKALGKEFQKAIDKEWTELKKNDIGGIYEDLQPKSKKIISDEEYASLMEKWGNIVGEKLLYPEEQEYQDARDVVLQVTENESAEVREKELKQFEYEWAHRNEWAKDRKDLERDHRNYMRMINNMTPEEYHNFMQLRDPNRASFFKNTTEVKTKDE